MRRIIWTVDPYRTDAEQLRNDGEILVRRFSEGRIASIEPVFVLTPAVSLMPSRSFDENLPRLKREARAKLDRYHAKLNPFLVSRPALLTRRSDHVESIVDAILDFATKRKACVIVARTHAKHAFARAIVGSVAETLMLRSSIPLLLLNPNTAAAPASENTSILFPTRLDRRAETTLERVARLAGSLGARIDLVHGMEAFDPDRKERSARMREAERLRNVAARLGIELRTHLSVTDLRRDEFILDEARRLRSTLIAMEADPERRAAMRFDRSVAKRVVRAAPCPVWVVGADRTDRFPKNVREEITNAFRE